MRLTWPLTGRSDETRLIQAAMFGPHVSGIVIRGAAGVGKSRIAREALAAAAESRNCEIRWAVGTSSARGLPLGAFAPWATPDVEDLRLVRGVIDALTSAPPNTTVIVGVDDAHLFDDLSAFVLHQIVARGAAKVVATLRDGEPVPTAIQDVWKAGQFERLDLQPLSREETTQLLSATLGGAVDPDAAARLWRLTRGNAFFLRNIVEQEVADGRLTQQQRMWRWTGEPIVPSNLVDLIESRIGNLPSSVAEVLDALAVAEPLTLASLQTITDPAAVEETELRGLITMERDHRDIEVRLAHPLYGEVRRKRAPVSRLRRLRGRVATELACRDDRDEMPMVMRRAALSMESELRPDPDLLVRAARGAVSQGNMQLADRLTEAAIRAGAPAEAYLVRAHVLGWLDRGEEAHAVLAHCPTDGFTDADHARLAFLRANNLLWNLADPTGAKQLIDDAAQIIPVESRSCIDAFLTLYWCAMDNPNAAWSSLKNLELDLLPGIVCAETACRITDLYGAAGRTTEAVAAADPGYAVLAHSFDGFYMRLMLADRHVEVLLLSGQIKEARDVAEQLRRHAADLPGNALVLTTAVVGRAALGAGELDKACSLLAPVVDMSSRFGGSRGPAYHYQPQHTIALAMRGLTDEACAALAAMDKHQDPARRYLDWERLLAKAWVSATQGAVAEAVSTMLSAAEKARRDGTFAVEVFYRQTATQFGDRSSRPRLAELAEIVEGPRAPITARFAAALCDGDGAELAAVSEDFERIGDLVAAADAAAHAALAYRRADLRGSSLTCSTRADALAQRCGGADTPVLRQASQGVPLTDREREIVMLIGEGLSSRAVADRLTLSVRTIENHIYRAMAKTGVTSRAELAALLPRQGKSFRP